MYMSLGHSFCGTAGIAAIPLAACLMVGGCTTLPKGELALDLGIKDRGVASWYGKEFHGKLAANGCYGSWPIRKMTIGRQSSVPEHSIGKLASSTLLQILICRQTGIRSSFLSVNLYPIRHYGLISLAASHGNVWPPHNGATRLSHSRYAHIAPRGGSALGESRHRVEGRADRPSWPACPAPDLQAPHPN